MDEFNLRELTYAYPFINKDVPRVYFNEELALIVYFCKNML